MREATAKLRPGTTEAFACQRKAAERFQDEFVVWFDLGQAYQSMNDLKQSQTAYERALDLKPDFVHAMNNLGAVYKEMGKHKLCKSILGRGMRLDPKFAGLDYNLGMLYAKTKNWKKAIKHLSASLAKAQPPEPPPRWHHDLAGVLEVSGRFSEALDAAGKAAALDPASEAFQSTHARLVERLDAFSTGSRDEDTMQAMLEAARLENRGDIDEAYELYTEMADEDPDDADLQYRLAWNRYGEEDYYPAHTHLTSALELAPENVDYLEFMGVLLHETGNWDDAVVYIERAVQTALANPERDVKEYGQVDHETFYNLGIAYKDLQDHQKCADSFYKAFRDAKVDNITVSSRADLNAVKLKYVSLAIEHANQACDWRTMSSLLPAFIRRLEAADPVALAAADPYDILLYTAKPEIALAVAESYVKNLTETAAGTGGLEVLRYDEWLNMAFRLRVGVLSADLRTHPVAQTLLGVMNALRSAGKDLIHLMAFSLCPEKPDDATQQAIREEFDEWRCLHGLSDADAATEIAQAGVHVMIDLQGHTLHRRPGIVLRQPAPLTIAMQGFAASTGFPTSVMPYLVADRVVFPPEIALAPSTRTEHLLYMPYSFFGCGYTQSLAIAPAHIHGDDARTNNVSGGENRAQLATASEKSWVAEEEEWEASLDQLKLSSLLDVVDEVLLRSPHLAAPNGALEQLGIVKNGPRQDNTETKFQTTDAVGHENVAPTQPDSTLSTLCANIRVAKIDPQLLKVWANVLRMSPRSKLLLDGRQPNAVTNLVLEASSLGINSAHIQSTWEQNFEQYLRRAGKCVALLDGMMYSAHTVGADALYMGTPLITVAGGKMANRVGASLMTAAGLGLHVSASTKAYEDDAIEYVRLLRRGIVDVGDKAPTAIGHARNPPTMPRPSRDSMLFDAQKWGQALMGGLRSTWVRHRANTTLTDLDVIAESLPEIVRDVL
jgi:predicted O-linked N-acetylglucosamine transferase (SPINDLY family)